MKIEYIPDGSKDCPLILIHGPDVNAIICLRQVCFNLTNGQAEFLSCMTFRASNGKCPANL